MISNHEMVAMVRYVHSANLKILLFKLNTCGFSESFLETMLHVHQERCCGLATPGGQMKQVPSGHVGSQLTSPQTGKGSRS